MVFFANFYGIFFGILFGLSIALYITVKMVKESNDIGDSQGEFYDFGDYIHPLQTEDDLKHIY